MAERMFVDCDCRDPAHMFVCEYDTEIGMVWLMVQLPRAAFSSRLRYAWRYLRGDKRFGGEWMATVMSLSEAERVGRQLLAWAKNRDAAPHAEREA